MDIGTLTVTELSAAFAEERLDPVTVTEAFLDRIAAEPAASTIFSTVSKDRALVEAKAAQGRQSAEARLGPLDGLPISWKDLFDTAAIPTEAGSKLLEGRIPEKDCDLVSAATSAGAICLGKTHMSELAFSGLGLNPMTATPPNVNVPNAVPGGSSSGAAASVAFGLAPAAIGSDTGGSIRIPAAWNDLVGFKPRHGVLSTNGVVPLCPRFDTAGPLTRTVADAALLFDVLSGKTQPADRHHNGALKLAVLETAVLDDFDDQVATAFETALSAIVSTGAMVQKVTFPQLKDALALSAILFTTEAYGTWKTTIEAAPEKMFTEILERFRSGAQHTGSDYVAAWQDLDRYRQAAKVHFEDFDALIMPTCPILPPDKDRLDQDTAFYKKANLLTLRNTRVGNLLDACAITLPGSGLSVGTMLMDVHGDHDRLLAIATQLEPILRNSD